MAASTPLLLGQKSQDALVVFNRECYTMLRKQWNIRAQMRNVDLAVAREVDYTDEHRKAQRANKLGDPTKFQNVTVPICSPQVEAAVTYQASVFLSGTPIIDWIAPPSQMDAASQFSAITEENSIRGGWTQHILMFLRDGFKYNLGFLETTFGRIITAAVETDTAMAQGRIGVSKEVIWQGNILKRWDPYNTFWDTRYHASQVYKHGEFIGQTEIMSRIHLKKFIAELPDKMISNIKVAFESGIGGPLTTGNDSASYYIPAINPNALSLYTVIPGTTNWMSWAGLLTRPQNEIQYKDVYEVTTLYARIIPQDFKINVPSANTPQVWKFIFVNQRVLIYAERQTNVHGFLPVLIGQPNEDGLGYQTKSLADNVRPFQEVGSALINSAMAARRRAISDRGVYNPLLISAKDINNDSPTAKIPMRPAGYNKAPSDAYAAIPFRDESSGTAFQELGQIINLSNTLVGSNQAKQGQFIKGNRTLHEYESVMANANGRDQMISLVLEAQVFTPMKEIIKLNTLQFQQGISIYSPKQDKTVKIDPIALRKAAISYKITDGQSPNDKVINGDDFAIALQTLGSSPHIGAGYNIAPMFSYLMKTRHIDLKPFEKSPEQQAYEQAMAAWQNAAAQVAELAKTVSMKIEGVTMDAIQGMIQKLLPVQPTPQQYNYNPNTQQQQSSNPPGASNNPAQGSTPVSNPIQQTGSLQ